VKARVLVRLKTGILDAQGATVKRALDGLGFHEVRDVRVGKVVDLDLDEGSADQARRRLDEMCARLLVNPVIEDFTVEMVGDGLLPDAGAKGRLNA
jgi:phosphoribosylformylglycinamidine synthase PurS subunit